MAANQLVQSLGLLGGSAEGLAKHGVQPRRQGVVARSLALLLKQHKVSVRQRRPRVLPGGGSVVAMTATPVERHCESRTEGDRGGEGSVRAVASRPHDLAAQRCHISERIVRRRHHRPASFGLRGAPRLGPMATFAWHTGKQDPSSSWTRMSPRAGAWVVVPGRSARSSSAPARTLVPLALATTAPSSKFAPSASASVASAAATTLCDWSPCAKTAATAAGQSSKKADSSASAARA